MGTKRTSLLAHLAETRQENTKRAGEDSDAAVVQEIRETTNPPIPLNPKSKADVETARAIKKGRELSTPVEGKPPVA